jgi:hypothetical protein
MLSAAELAQLSTTDWWLDREKLVVLKLYTVELLRLRAVPVAGTAVKMTGV